MFDILDGLMGVMQVLKLDTFMTVLGGVAKEGGADCSHYKCTQCLSLEL